MALGTDVVTFGDKLITVRVVAVATDNPRLIHLALYEGSVDIHLIANLSVRPVKRILYQRQPMGI